MLSVPAFQWRGGREEWAAYCAMRAQQHPARKRKRKGPQGTLAIASMIWPALCCSNSNTYNCDAQTEMPPPSGDRVTSSGGARYACPFVLLVRPAPTQYPRGVTTTVVESAASGATAVTGVQNALRSRPSEDGAPRRHAFMRVPDISPIDCSHRAHARVRPPVTGRGCAATFDAPTPAPPERPRS